MSARTFALSLCVVPALASAHAQTSVYAVGGLAGYGHTVDGNSTLYYKGDTGGFGGGLFYNFPIQSRVTVGLDARALGSPGNKGGYLAGGALRVGFVPHHNPLRPFVQIGGGIVHTSYQVAETDYNQFGNVINVTTVSHSVTSGALQLNFGLDIRLTDHLDLRAPEYGAQAGGSAAAAFLNVGLVYHLHPRA